MDKNFQNFNEADKENCSKMNADRDEVVISEEEVEILSELADRFILSRTEILTLICCVVAIAVLLLTKDYIVYLFKNHLIIFIGATLLFLLAFAILFVVLNNVFGNKRK